MNFLPERDYNMMKANLHWDSFVQRRGSYVEQVVREFYVGIQDPKEDTSSLHADI